MKKSALLKMNLMAEYRVELAMTLALILLGIGLSLLSPQFLTVGNFRNLLWQATAIGIISIGQTLVILTSGIDLSVGGIAAFSVMLGGMVVVKVGVPIGIVVILLLGMFVGLVNGCLIAYAKLAPFIVTLGMLSITRSLTYVVNDGRSLVGLPPAYRMIGRATIAGVPFYTLLLISLFILGHILLTKTKIGRFLYAIGSNEEAARLTGVDVRFYKTLAYILTGCLCSIAVIILTSRLGAIDPDTGTGMELDAIASAVIGGSSLSGGKGSLIGTFIGVFLITILHNGLNLIGVSPFWQGSAVGSVIIISVLLDRLLS